MHDPIEHLFRQTEQVQHFHCGSFDRRNHLVMRVSTVKRKGEPKNSGLPFKKKTPNATQLSYSSVALQDISPHISGELQKLVKNGGTPWYPPNQTILVLKSHGLEFPQNPHPPASLSTALARMSPCRTSLRCTLTWWRAAVLSGMRAWKTRDCFGFQHPFFGGSWESTNYIKLWNMRIKTLRTPSE